jgi:hypothetical protein
MRVASQREARAQGVLFFRTLLLDKQKKGTRPQPRSGGVKAVYKIAEEYLIAQLRYDRKLALRSR